MRKLDVFNSISLDGYFTDANGDVSWAHDDRDDPEFASFTIHGDPEQEMPKIKAEAGVLGAGRTLFEGLTKKLRLKRVESRAFQNGKTYVRYEAGSALSRRRHLKRELENP